MQAIILTLVLSVLIFVVVQQAYTNIKDLAEEEAAEKVKRTIAAERRKASAYCAAYESIRHNTRIEVTQRGDWASYDGSTATVEAEKYII